MTADDLRISDWSSDVCSSDLRRFLTPLPIPKGRPRTSSDAAPDYPLEHPAATGPMARFHDPFGIAGSLPATADAPRLVRGAGGQPSSSFRLRPPGGGRLPVIATTMSSSSRVRPTAPGSKPAFGFRGAGGE